MKILLSGARGFLGSHVDAFFTNRGDIVTHLVRSTKQAGVFFTENSCNITDLEGFDIVIHLAGEPLLGLWTAKKKKAIYESRVLVSRALCKALIQLKNPPKLYIQASAAGFYGDQGSELLDESSPSGQGFLSGVCEKWEKETEILREKNIATLLLRTGVVLGDRGFFPLHKTLHRWYLGAVLGTGEQYISLIHIKDWIGALHHCIEQKILGPVNFTSKEPIEQRELALVLSKTLNRPLLFRIPKALLLFCFGRLARELFLSSTRALPEKLDSSGYTFFYPSIRESIASLCKTGS